MDMQLIQKAQNLERQSKEAEASLQFINQTIAELEDFKVALEDFKNSKPGSEIFSQLGNRVYAKTELKDNNVLVDVGAGVLVKKTPEEARKTVEEQLEKLKQAKVQVTEQLESYAQSFVGLMSELQKKQQEEASKKSDK